MQNLKAQVTSSLLAFPDVTLKALKEDEISLDSVLWGKFSTGKSGLTCLACGPQLEVTNSLTGERLSAYHFSGVTERPPTVVAVKEFSWQKKSGLLVGLVEAEGSVLCLYDLGISRVVKAIVLPGSVTAVEPIINHGGASASTQHLHQSLRWFFGVAAVATDVGHILLIDLCLDDASISQDELDASDLEVMSGVQIKIPKLREAATRERRHLCLQLLAPSGTMVSSLSYISKTNQLAVGFSDGHLSLWNMKTLRRDYHVQIEGGKVPVCAVTFQEPENDPRNCCYLWAVQSSQGGGDVSLHLLQLAFSDRKCLASGQILYELLEYCEERYSLDLSDNALRGQTNNTKLLGCQTIEKFRMPGEREDGVHEVTSPDTSVSVFSWQVNTYGQGKPSVYLGVFDINRWYQAQMPDSLRSGQFLQSCAYFAFWSLETVHNVTQDSILDVIVRDRSLSRGVPATYPPPEQFYYPSTYNFDATCLLRSGIIHISCTGFQKETLQFLKKSGCSLNEAVSDGYNRCLVAGLLSPRFSDVQPSSMSQEEQLQAILSAAIETNSLGLLTSCIKQWTVEEQPRSAANLRFVLEWTWKKVTFTKQEFDRLSVRLFDGSSNFIDPHTLQSLQQFHLHFCNLTAVLNCFLTEAQELTKQGIADLSNRKSVTKLLTLYTSVVLWFCRSGLLPDISDDTMQLSRPYYNYQAMHHYYEDQRKKLEHLARGKWNTSSLMIDGLINQFGDRIEQLWSRDENGTGKYPPANLHALLDLYLLENVDEMSKHEITIYFLLDLLYSSPDKPDCAIESFPTAFSVPYGRIKLIQGFWLMDHNDYQNSVDCILHPASSQVISWQHLQIVETLMCQGDQRQALRYIQAMKPAAATSEEVKLHITVLLANRYILEAWNLQRLHSSQLNVQELLEHMYETCREMGLMEDLLKLNFTDSEQESLQKFLQTTGAKNQELLLVHHLQRANYIPALQLNQSLKTIHMNDCDRRLRERAVARNAILDQYGKILPRVQRTLASERAKPYSLSFVWREVSRPKPLSTIAKPAFPGSIITKANFISNVLSKIKEVSAANDNREEFSPYKSFVNEDALLANSIQDSEPPAAFFVTPVTKSRRVSRLLDSVVHPVLTEPSLLAYSLADDIYQTPNNKSLKKTSSPLHSSLRKIAHLRSFVKTSEFDLLLTPLVVRKAKALANITTSSGFAGITPQSILRSSLRTTPLVSPSVSPGRSLTPPLRHKETKISFMEEIKNKGSNGVKLLDVSPVLKSSPDAMWSEKKVTVFTDSTSVERFVGKDKSPGMLERSPDKMEVSKASNASVRSDQTTLEYHDAPTPENFENAEFLLTTDSHQQVIEQTSCLFEIEGGLSEKETILQQIDISNFESECLSAHLNCPNMLEQVTGKDVYLKKVVESFSKTSEVCLPCGTGEPECGSSAKDSESVITINDSEDIQSSLSENQDEGTGFRKNIIDAEQPANSGTASDGLSLQALEPKAQNVQLEENESEETNYKELYTCEAVKLGINVESIEQCYTCEITDDKDSNEQFEAENNFSLILESGDADDEILETESCKRDQLQLARPAISSRVNCSDLIENICNHKEEVIPLLTNEFSPVENDLESKVGKTLPYVPEPIKITNMENLIEVLKNTSKEVSHEFNNESSSESEPLGEIMITHATSKLPMDNTNTNSISKVEELETLERKMDNVNELRVSPNVYKPAGVKSATPRRSIRNSLKTTESSIANSRAKVLPVTPKKVAKKAKDLETVENCVSTIQKEEIYISTKRMTRKTNIATSEKPEQTGSEEATFKETLLVLTPTRGRKARALETDKESDQEEFSLPITPTRMTRSRMSLDPEKSTSHIEETVENDQVYVTPKRGRRAKRVVNELVRHFENNSSQPSHKVDISPSASPKRMSRRWTRSKSENQIYNAPEEEAEKNQEQTTDTPTKRCKMSPTDQMHMEETSDVNSDHTTEENVQISVTRHSTKKATISRSVKKAALSPVNEEKLLGNCSNIDDDNEENKTTRITRTRARNKNTLPEVSAINFEFSTPTSRTKKPPKGSSVPPEIIQLDPAQYVFSPPSTRTRRATRSGTSEAANEKDLHVQDSQEFLTVSKEPSSRPKGRPPIHKSTRSSRAQKKSSWSTPPVEVKLISPPESPAVSTAHTKTEPTESKGAEKNIRQTRRRIIMLKPVTRRKVR